MNEKRLGISIYPEIVGAKPTIEYIKLAHENGFQRIFANLLEVDDNEEGQEKLRMFKEVYTYAKELGFEVIVDVNPMFYKVFNLPKTEIDFFKKLGATGIRLDEDFKGVVESQLSNNDSNFVIELNASSGSETIDLTLEQGGNPSNLMACHNFYPMRYTGLAYERFIQLSSHFKSKGMKVAAFVTLPEKQKGIGPWNVNEGMPTIEEHRDLSLRKQIEHLIALDVVDDIIISQQGATEEQFKQMAQIIKQTSEVIESDVVQLSAVLDKDLPKVYSEIVTFAKEFEFEGKLTKSHSNRPDYNSFFVRSTLPRLIYKEEKISPLNSGKKLVRGDIVILNENLGRYKGELHILLKDIDDSSQQSRNLIGRVKEEELFKLDLIKGGKAFKINA